jgi:hypothetical protein
MKKLYEIPAVQVVALQTAQLMAASPVFGGTTDETGGNLSREFDIEDDSELLNDDTVLDI